MTDQPGATPPVLRPHLGLTGATALAVTVVVGSGALVLPGIAYAQAGATALYSWILAALITVPLLVVFARLGSRYPGAGGVAGFVKAGFGRRAAAGVEVVLLGTFGLGIPAIALTGGNYVCNALNVSTSWAAAVATALLVGCGLVVSGGAKISGDVQTILAVTLTVGLAAAAAIAIAVSRPSSPPLDGTHGAFDLGLLLSTVGVVFFAFTGWEMISFTTEEYKNPSRDFPRVLILSFVLVTAMYLLLALGLQTQLAPDDPLLTVAPISAMVEHAVGPAGGLLVSVLGIVVVVANLIGAIWGASRLVMSSAREGLLPAALATLSPHSSSPRRAVAACVGFFVTIALASGAGALPLATLLGVAGKNFFVLYLLCAAVYSRISHGTPRVFGLIVLIALSVVTLGFGTASWVYIFALLGTGILIDHHRRAKAQHDDAEPSRSRSVS